jgi:hypothetical protein
MENKYKNYHKSIDEIISFLKSDKSQDNTILAKVQVKLCTLAKQYQDDENLGPDRYKLYQAQAMLDYRNYYDALAIEGRNKAIEIRGSTFDFADEFIANINKSSKQNVESIDQRNKRIRDHYTGIGGIAGIIVGIFGSKFMPVTNILITLVCATILGGLFAFIASRLTDTFTNKSE